MTSELLPLVIHHAKVLLEINKNIVCYFILFLFVFAGSCSKREVYSCSSFGETCGEGANNEKPLSKKPLSKIYMCFRLVPSTLQCRLSPPSCQCVRMWTAMWRQLFLTSLIFFLFLRLLCFSHKFYAQQALQNIKDIQAASWATNILIFLVIYVAKLYELIIAFPCQRQRCLVWSSNKIDRGFSCKMHFEIAHLVYSQ